MVENFAAGGAAINQLCASFELASGVRPGADLPPATSRGQHSRRRPARHHGFGMEAIAGGIDLLALGEMGIGNTPSPAIYTASMAAAVRWVGRAPARRRGLAASRGVEAAMARHQASSPIRSSAAAGRAARSPRWPARSWGAASACRSSSTAMW